MTVTWLVIPPTAIVSVLLDRREKSAIKVNYLIPLCYSHLAFSAKIVRMVHLERVVNLVNVSM